MQYDRNGALLASTIPGCPEPHRGKVRDIYDFGDELLLVATDRISAFDCVMPNGIPDKGKVLTQVSLFWFDFLDVVPNHLISADTADYPEACHAVGDDLAGRSMLVKKSQVVPIECIARGYLVGSGWKEYQKQGTVCGIELKAGYEQAAKLEEPIFTPSTKAEFGLHDENISFAEAAKKVGSGVADQLKAATLALYSKAADYALTKGIIIADTKFEFGLEEGSLILVDEVLTPDSSRFWPADSYATGSNPPSLDKQFVRDYLESIGFGKNPPAPDLPDEVVEKTRAKYLDALKRISGKGLA